MKIMSGGFLYFLLSLLLQKGTRDQFAGRRSTKTGMHTSPIAYCTTALWGSAACSLFFFLFPSGWVMPCARIHGFLGAAAKPSRNRNRPMLRLRRAEDLPFCWSRLVPRTIHEKAVLAMRLVPRMVPKWRDMMGVEPKWGFRGGGGEQKEGGQGRRRSGVGRETTGLGLRRQIARTTATTSRPGVLEEAQGGPDGGYR